MLHELTSDQDMLRDTTARFLSDRVPLSLMRKELRHDPHGFDPAWWASGAELGWCMLLASEDEGGGSVSGRGVSDLALIAYEFGKHAAPGPLADCNVAVAALSGNADEAQSAALAEILSGQALASSCLGAAPWHKPGEAGVTIRRDGDDVIIDGKVKPAESAAQAAHLLVTGQSEGGMTQLLIPASARGVSIKPLQSIDVTRRFGAVSFDNVRAPASALLGEFGRADDRVARQAVRNAEDMAALQKGQAGAPIGKPRVASEVPLMINARTGTEVPERAPTPPTPIQR